MQDELKSLAEQNFDELEFIETKVHCFQHNYKGFYRRTLVYIVIHY